jgi:DNA-binding NarL/FixJ family response regulator
MFAEKSNIWLVGPSVTGNWELIRALKSDHVITLIEAVELDRLVKQADLRSADLIVVDYGVGHRTIAPVLKAIRAMKEKFPDLIILLTNGELSQSQVRLAYRAGAREVYQPLGPPPDKNRLLAEKIIALCRRKPA